MQRTGPGQIAVLVVDDHPLVLDMVRLLLDGECGISVKATTRDGYAAAEMVEQLHPDVVVLDLAMEPCSGLEALRRIHTHCPDVRIIVLTVHDEPQYRIVAQDAGAAAYVLKEHAARELVPAILGVPSN